MNSENAQGSGWELRHSFEKHVIPPPFLSGLYAEKHTIFSVKLWKNVLMGGGGAY